jgi:tetratricopeptide (TPR) repeat protein
MHNLKFEAILALLRATGWDSEYLGKCVPFLIETLPNAEARLRLDLLEGIQRAWEQYYPIGETDDVPFGLGALLYTLERYPEALGFFERSLEQFGEDPRTTLNIALTLYHMQRLSESLVWLDRTLALDPSNELAREMRPSVAAELDAST